MLSSAQDRLQRPARRRFVGIAAVVLLCPGTLVAQTTANREPTLEERLLNGLQARRPSEIAFIDAVVDTVNRGEISQRIVDRFFNWSRSRAVKRGRRTRPIIYFQPGLTEQATRLRIAIAADPS